ncbi:MAG: hypothetical protein EB051_00660 [Chlamydiia bacterium]|nr:hypothetical protein [Chlamydiia bacterium]
MHSVTKSPSLSLFNISPLVPPDSKRDQRREPPSFARGPLAIDSSDDASAIKGLIAEVTKRKQELLVHELACKELGKRLTDSFSLETPTRSSVFDPSPEFDDQSLEADTRFVSLDDSQRLGRQLPDYVVTVLSFTDESPDDSLEQDASLIHRFVCNLLKTHEEDTIELLSSLNDREILKSLSTQIRSACSTEVMEQLTEQLTQRHRIILCQLAKTRDIADCFHMIKLSNHRFWLDFLFKVVQTELDLKLRQIEGNVPRDLDAINRLEWSEEGKRALGVRVIEHASDLSFKVKTLAHRKIPSNIGVGLVNPHNNCWVNSGLQMIARSPVMRGWIDIIQQGLDNLPNFEQGVYAEAMCSAINQFITELESGQPPSISSVNTQVIRQAMQVLKPQSFQGRYNSQEEAVELFTCLSALADTILSNRADPLHTHRSIKDQFCMFEKRIYQATGECEPLTEEERDPDLYEPDGPGRPQDVPILVLKPGDHEFHSRHLQAFESNRGRISDQQRAEWEKLLAQAFLQRLFVEEGPVTKTFLDEVEGVRSKRKYVSNQMTKRYEAPPSCLFFNINLDVYDQVTGEASKLVTRGQDGKAIPVKVPLMERFTLPSDYVGEPATYEVCSTIVHSGGAQTGHYVYYEKRADGQWVCYNDSLVEAVPADQEDDIKGILQEASFVYYRKLEQVDQQALLIGGLNDVEAELDKVKGAILPQSLLANLFNGSSSVREGVSLSSDENTSIFSSMLSYGIVFAKGVRDILDVISRSITESSYGFWLWLTGRNEKDSGTPPNGEESIPDPNA